MEEELANLSARLNLDEFGALNHRLVRVLGGLVCCCICLLKENICFGLVCCRRKNPLPGHFQDRVA